MFIVLRVEAIDSHLHGYVSRYLHEIDTSTYVGKMNRKTLEQLWKAVEENLTTGKAYIVVSDGTREEGFTLKMTEGCDFVASDHDGITLIHKRNKTLSDIPFTAENDTPFLSL